MLSFTSLVVDYYSVFYINLSIFFFGGSAQGLKNVKCRMLRIYIQL